MGKRHDIAELEYHKIHNFEMPLHINGKCKDMKKGRVPISLLSCEVKDKCVNFK